MPKPNGEGSRPPADLSGQLLYLWQPHAAIHSSWQRRTTSACQRNCPPHLRFVTLTIKDMDSLSKAHRSWNMSRIRSRDTVPELAVRSVLHRLGYRFRLHRRDLPGCPDIILTRLRTVIFVHGCFWHRHQRCRYAYTPKTRRAFWQKKFADNVDRDHRVKAALRKLGWHIIVVWECQTEDTSNLEVRLTRGLQSSSANKL